MRTSESVILASAALLAGFVGTPAQYSETSAPQLVPATVPPIPATAVRARTGQGPADNNAWTKLRNLAPLVMPPSVAVPDGTLWPGLCQRPAPCRLLGPLPLYVPQPGDVALIPTTWEGLRMVLCNQPGGGTTPDIPATDRVTSNSK